MKDESPESPDTRFAEFILLLVTLVWGATFLVTQTALDDSGPFSLLAVRFAIGALTLAAVLHRRMRHLTRTEILGGVAIGIIAFISYAGQTAGLQYIPSSQSAFITALYVPIVPILQLVLLGKAPRISAWLGVAISFAGLLLLAWDDEIGLAMGAGEWLTLLGAVGAGFQIIAISHWAERTDPLRLATVQLAVVSALSFVAWPLSGEAAPSVTLEWVAAVVALGLLGTAFGLGAMNWAQRTVSATRATVLYSMEPVWAGLFGAVAGEPMSPTTLGGSGLILTGVLVSEVRWGRLWRRGRSSGSGPFAAPASDETRTSAD